MKTKHGYRLTEPQTEFLMMLNEGWEKFGWGLRKGYSHRRFGPATFFILRNYGYIDRDFLITDDGQRIAVQLEKIATFGG